MTDIKDPRLDKATGFKLIETGTLVDFDILSTDIQPSPDGEETAVRIELQLGEEGEDGDRTEDHEWGAFGFLFVLGLLSFADARPRNASEIEYDPKDEFTILEFMNGLRYERGELRFSGDYVKGRCVKTDITVRADGTATLSTRNRGEAAVRWVQRLKGKKVLEAVT